MLGSPIRKSADISDICSSPRLIAACHVLLRLLMPRHSPCALFSLTCSSQSPLVSVSGNSLRLLPKTAPAPLLLAFLAQTLALVCARRGDAYDSLLSQRSRSLEIFGSLKNYAGNSTEDFSKLLPFTFYGVVPQLKLKTFFPFGNKFDFRDLRSRVSLMLPCFRFSSRCSVFKVQAPVPLETRMKYSIRLNTSFRFQWWR